MILCVRWANYFMLPALWLFRLLSWCWQQPPFQWAGAHRQTGENAKLVCAEFSTLGWVVLLLLHAMRALTWTHTSKIDKLGRLRSFCRSLSRTEWNNFWKSVERKSGFCRSSLSTADAMKLVKLLVAVLVVEATVVLADPKPGVNTVKLFFFVNAASDK